jgi:hypothetical protein
VQVTVWLMAHLHDTSGGDAAGRKDEQALGVIDTPEDVARRSAATSS